MSFPVAGKTHCALIAAHANDVQRQERNTKGRRYRTRHSKHTKVVVPICITKWNLTLKVKSYVGSKNKMVFDSPKFWRKPNLQKGMHASCCQRYASRGKRGSATCLVIRHRHSVTQACKRKKKIKNSKGRVPVY